MTESAMTGEIEALAGDLLYHETGDRITRKDLNNAYRMGQENARLAAELLGPSLAEAADALTRLTAELARVEGELRQAALNYLALDWQATDALDRALTAEAALAKAVEAEREAFKAGLEEAAQFLEACDDYGDRHKAAEIRSRAQEG